MPGIARRDLARLLEEEAVGRAHDVRLVDHRDLLPPVLPGVLERRAHDALAALLRVHLAGDRVGVGGEVLEGRERLAQLRQRGRQLGRHRAELDPGVQVLRVLAEDDEVDPLLEVERVARRTPCTAGGRRTGRTSAASARSASGRPAPCPCSCRRQLRLRRLRRLGGDGAEHRRVHLLQQLDRARREGIALPAPELPADVAVRVLRVELQLVQDEPRRVHDVLADAVARQPGDRVLGHRHHSGRGMGPGPRNCKKRAGVWSGGQTASGRHKTEGPDCLLRPLANPPTPRAPGLRLGPGAELLVQPRVPVVERHQLAADEDVLRSDARVERVAVGHDQRGFLPGLDAPQAVGDAEDLGGVDGDRLERVVGREAVGLGERGVVRQVARARARRWSGTRS